jgi:hypothetical protein
MRQESYGRGSSRQHCCTARAQGYITLPERPTESINNISQQKKKRKEDAARNDPQATTAINMQDMKERR